MPQLSVLGENLLKDGVLVGSALLTAAESLRAAHAGNRSVERSATGYRRHGWPASVAGSAPSRRT
jgi:hypothetical protein